VCPVAGKAHSIRIRTAHEATDKAEWFTVEGPYPRSEEAQAPFRRQLDHAFLRPYQILLKDGRPDVGHVQYAVGTLNGQDPRVLAAIALRRKPQRPGNYLPMDLTIFPGISTKHLMAPPSGSAGSLQHISVRDEERGGIQVYSNIQAPGKVFRPTKNHRLHPNLELGGLLHIGQMYIRNWKALDPCGVATWKVEPHISAQVAKARAKYPWNATVHSLTNLVPSPELAAVPNHLWQGFYLSARELDHQDRLDLLSFVTEKVMPHLSAITTVPDFQGDLEGTLTAIGLDYEGPSTAPWKFLNIVTAILPGRLHSQVAVVSLPQQLAILRNDFKANPAAFEAELKRLRDEKRQ
jgi:hypothetical protein